MPRRTLRWLTLEGGRTELFRHLIILLLLALVAQQAAKLVWSLAERPRTSPVSLADLRRNDPAGESSASGKGVDFGEKLASLHIFGEPESTLDNEPVAAPENVPETTLSLTLRGVIASSPMRMAVAVISEQGKDEDNSIYRVGDEVAGKARLKAIHSDRVILERAGKLETLFLEEPEQDKQAASSKSVNGEHRQVKRRYLNRKMENIRDLAREVKVNSYQRNGKQYGYRITSAGNDKFLKNLGLKPGDILYEINGIRLNDSSRIMSAYEKLQEAKEIWLVIERNEQRQTKTYSIR